MRKIIFGKNIKKKTNSTQKMFIGVKRMSKACDSALSNDLYGNVTVLRSIFADCEDAVFHDISVRETVKSSIIYIQGLTDTAQLDLCVLKPIIEAWKTDLNLSDIREHVAITDIKEITYFEDIVQMITSGNPVMLVQGVSNGFVFGLSKWEQRSLEESQAESVIRGTRESFTETLGTNMALLRRRLKNPSCKMKKMTIGRYSQTSVVLAYIEGIADPRLITEVQERLRTIDVDGVLESGVIEEWIEETNYSPFPQMQNTERPDAAAAALLEGRIVIITDTTPFVLILPTTFFSFFQSPEDYYQRFPIGTAIRWVRYLFVCVSLIAPSTYVAVLTYHQEMIPTTLLLRIAKSREEIPFPALFEAFLMEVTFEALREAGVRLPKQIGAAVSIVGALVIGQAAIQAGLVSAPMVMVVAITGISSFMIPQYSASIPLRLLRFPLMLLAGSFGLLGMMLGILAIISHMCILTSFGVPYMSTMAPMNVTEMKDVLIRAPWKQMRKRPAFSHALDRNRLKLPSENDKGEQE
ncbi:spore germination protein [Paenibacillus aestuarii]|uniref:Spore germination protein n=1 Tax=Paenibacillus aestuarii TaxID=516965 RepID=A0ABW0K826_9BACL|nr:spore germination protein [Paenibacillus aestuarii]